MQPADPYRLVVTATAKRQLSLSLPSAVAFAAYEFVSGPLLTNPHRVGKALRAPLTGHYSARRGTYRILYLIDDEQRTVTVLTISHRKDAYRTR